MRGISLSDGVYNITVDGKTFPVYCDMTKDEGGWTLVLFGTTNRTSNQWNEDTVKRMNEHNPSIDTEYSILYRAHSIKNQGIGNTFQVSCCSNIMSWMKSILNQPVIEFQYVENDFLLKINSAILVEFDRLVKVGMQMAF